MRGVQPDVVHNECDRTFGKWLYNKLEWPRVVRPSQKERWRRSRHHFNVGDGIQIDRSAYEKPIAVGKPIAFQKYSRGTNAKYKKQTDGAYNQTRLQLWSIYHEESTNNNPWGHTKGHNNHSKRSDVQNNFFLIA
jgi:hypothetical protein